MWTITFCLRFQTLKKWDLQAKHIRGVYDILSQAIQSMALFTDLSPYTLARPRSSTLLASLIAVPRHNSRLHVRSIVTCILRHVS